MFLSPPCCLQDVITDGLFITAGVDHALMQQFGAIRRVECTFPPEYHSPDGNAPARLITDRGIFNAQAQLIATTEQGVWVWKTRAIENIDVPEIFDGTTPHGALMKVARTLVAGRPVLAVPTAQGANIVAIETGPLQIDPRIAVSRGLSALEKGMSEVRAMAAFATVRGWSGEHTDTGLTLDNGIFVTYGQEGHIVEVHAFPSALREKDVLADALFVAAEHQMLLDGRFPGHSTQLDLANGLARITSQEGMFIDASAHLVATVSKDRWTWAWADSTIQAFPIAQGSRQVARCGEDHGLMDLVRPHVPAEWAREGHFSLMAMPIMHVWTLVTTRLAPGTVGIALVDAPELRLPAAHPAATQAVFATPLPKGVDLERAVAAYARFRGLHSHGAAVFFPDGTKVSARPHAHDEAQD